MSSRNSCLPPSLSCINIRSSGVSSSILIENGWSPEPLPLSRLITYGPSPLNPPRPAGRCGGSIWLAEANWIGGSLWYLGRVSGEWLWYKKMQLDTDSAPIWRLSMWHALLEIKSKVLKLPVLSVMGTTGPTLDVFLPVQMSGRALEGPKDQKPHISASICPTKKYNLSNSQATHFDTHLR